MTLLILIILAYAIKAVMDFINQNGSGILMLLFELVNCRLEWQKQSECTLVK
jgi:hypothetical protein